MKTYLYLTKHHTMYSYLGVEVLFHSFLTSAVGGGSRQIHAPTGLSTARFGYHPLPGIEARSSSPQPSGYSD
jgi:hypothetical protein